MKLYYTDRAKYELNNALEKQHIIIHAIFDNRQNPQSLP